MYYSLFYIKLCSNKNHKGLEVLLILLKTIFKLTWIGIKFFLKNKANWYFVKGYVETVIQFILPCLIGCPILPPIYERIEFSCIILFGLVSAHTNLEALGQCLSELNVFFLKFKKLLKIP